MSVTSPSAAFSQVVLDAFEHPSAIFDGDGRCCLTNAAMRDLGVSIGQSLDDAVLRLTAEGRRFDPWRDGGLEHSIEIHLPQAGWKEVVKTPLDGGFVQVSFRDDLETRRREKALGILLGTRGGEDVFVLAAEALAVALGYRWAGVARFRREMREVELLGFWGDGARREVFTYDIAAKPCRAVATGLGFSMFPAHVAALFPGDVWLEENGAQSYVGQVYFGSDGRPCGHILAIHDRPDVETSAVRRMVDLIASMVSADLQRSHLSLQLEDVEREASTDSLTGLGNRRGFDRAIESRVGSIERGELLDVAIVCVDLDGFKGINDRHGHSAGDRLLCLFADGLRGVVRQSDGIFRIGGDEFAIVLSDASAATVGRIESGIDSIVAQLHVEGFARIGASAGHATLREVGFDVSAAMEAADRRMYETKREKRA